jgi:hypothetical protein
LTDYASEAHDLPPVTPLAWVKTSRRPTYLRD